MLQLCFLIVTSFILETQVYYALTLLSHRHKFHPRATTSVFVEYTLGIKGYRLYDIVTKSFFHTRDVVFHEKLFPCHSIPHSNDLIDPFSKFGFTKTDISHLPTPSIPNSTPSISPLSRVCIFLITLLLNQHNLEEPLESLNHLPN